MDPGSHVGFPISVKNNKSCIWPPNEHFCQVWFKSVLWFQKKRWKCEIPIGSNVKLSRVMVAILNFRSAKIHNFSTGPPNDHSCKVTIQLAKWFLRRRFLKFWPIRTHYGPWQPCWISDQRQKQKSCIWPSNEHFCHVWFKSVLWFQKKRWKCEIPIGSNVKLCWVMAAILNFRSANDSQV